MERCSVNLKFQFFSFKKENCMKVTVFTLQSVECQYKPLYYELVCSQVNSMNIIRLLFIILVHIFGGITSSVYCALFLCLLCWEATKSIFWMAN